MKTFLLYIALLSTSFAPLASQAPIDWQKSGSKSPAKHPSVALVVGNNWSCTGFVVAKDLVATAAHCVKEGAKHQIRTLDNAEMQAAEIYWVSERNDSALLKAKTGEAPPVSFASVRPNLGDALIHVRFDYQEQAQFYATGVYAQYFCPTDSYCLHWIAAALVPGDSGGPVFNTDGEVIGVTSKSFWPLNAPMSMLAPTYDLEEKSKTYKDSVGELDLLPTIPSMELPETF